MKYYWTEGVKMFFRSLRFFLIAATLILMWETMQMYRYIKADAEGFLTMSYFTFTITYLLGTKA
jgi:hypothetical protein